MGAPEIGAMIPIFGILAAVAFAYIRLRHRELKAASRQDSSGSAEEKRALENRVRTLEKIITDGGLQTAAQIEALRERPIEYEQKERTAK